MLLLRDSISFKRFRQPLFLFIGYFFCSWLWQERAGQREWANPSSSCCAVNVIKQQSWFYFSRILWTCAWLWRQSWRVLQVNCFQKLFLNGSGVGDQKMVFKCGSYKTALIHFWLHGFFILLFFATTLKTLTGAVNAIKCNAGVEDTGEQG